jgi:DNA-binding NarL/FixJ family response regulator
MKILLVEDDPNKSKQLLEFLRSALPNADLVLKRSYASGLKEIRDSNPDIVLLDMSLPNFDPDIAEDSGRFRSYGGRDIMQQVKRRNLSLKTIVVTMFGKFSTEKETITLAELSDQLSQEFPEIYLGTVFYDSSGDAWQQQLLGMIKAHNIEN